MSGQFAHFALEAEDGDGQTNQSCDSQTQDHRLGVVKAAEGTITDSYWSFKTTIITVCFFLLTWTRTPS